MENFREVKDMMTETIVQIVGIVVTIIGIIVTTVNTIQSYRIHKHQKSDRPHQG